MSSSQVVRTSTSVRTTYEGNKKKTVETVITQYADGRSEEKVFTKFEEIPRECCSSSYINTPGGCSKAFSSQNSPTQTIASSFNTPEFIGGNTSSSHSEQFEKEGLEAHNKYRKIHGAPPLELCDELNKHAKEWADHLARRDSFNHRPNGPYGENLFLKYGSGNTDCNGFEPVESWYSEIKCYTYGQSSGSSGTGHFTQVVWKGSKRLGMAKSRSASGKIIVVANYDPPGNYIGNYASNVLPPKF